ncbi:rCG29634, partial [Rattus norvegicus]
MSLLWTQSFQTNHCHRLTSVAIKNVSCLRAPHVFLLIRCLPPARSHLTSPLFLFLSLSIFIISLLSSSYCLAS